MSDNLSVIFWSGEALRWLRPGHGEVGSLHEPALAVELQAPLSGPDHGVVFAAPGGDVRLLELEIAPEERRHLDASLPFMLEESLSEPIENLHFARLALSRERYGVAIVSLDAMHEWQAALADASEKMPWVPEPLLLPWRDGEWSLLVDDRGVLIRSGECSGTRVEASLLPALLEAMLREAGPERVLVYGRDETADRQLLSGLGDVPVEWRRGGLPEAMLLAEPDSPGMNLLQGQFAPRLPYERWWTQWQGVAALLLVALSLHLLSGWLDLRRLERQNLALRSEIESVYREVNPRGAIVDAEKQLRRQLDGLRGPDGNSNFTALLASLAESLDGSGDTFLASLTYSARNGELRVNLLAPSFAEVESMRTALVSAGVEASLESSARSGDRVRARLRIGAGS